MRQLSAIAASTANSTALRFKTGSTPGSPRHTGHTLVFGGFPNFVEHEQKIFVSVSSWTWTSSPITGSYLARAATIASDAVTISSDYSRLCRRVPRALFPPALRFCYSDAERSAGRRNLSCPGAAADAKQIPHFVGNDRNVKNNKNVKAACAKPVAQEMDETEPYFSNGISK